MATNKTNSSESHLSTGSMSNSGGNGAGAFLDLSGLQSIQGHTINEGLQANQALAFASLISQTAQGSATGAVASLTQGIFKNPIFLAIVGGALFFLTYKTFKKRR